MKYQKITGLLGTTSVNEPRFITKKWIKFMISPVMLKTDTIQANK